MALPRGAYADPLDCLMRSCHGCAQEEEFEIAGSVVRTCANGRQHGQRCRLYEEKKAMTLEERLDNWGRVVRSPKYQTGVCAAWAKWYVAKRGGDESPELVTSIPPEERDAWDVERAWSAMQAPVAKWLLKYHYVWRMHPEQIRVQMFKKHSTRIHRSQMEVYIADARSRLTRELVRITANKIIRTAAFSSCKPERSIL